jgi:SAM-dependent methyltransferase
MGLKDVEYYDNLRLNEWKELDSVGPSSRSRYRIICNLIKKYRFLDNLLDVGCGSGVLLTYIKNKNHFRDLWGSDFSQQSIVLAKSLHFNVFRADLLHLGDFSGCRYNSVICSEVLEHIEDDEKAIANLFELLQPGGKIIVTVPFSMNYWSDHDEFAGHIRRYELEELKEKFMRNNFRILDLFIWGSGPYGIYHRILMKTNPKKIMRSDRKTTLLKRIGGSILYYIFFIDDLFLSEEKGRRIFLVAEKNRCLSKNFTFERNNTDSP